MVAVLDAEHDHGLYWWVIVREFRSGETDRQGIKLV